MFKVDTNYLTVPYTPPKPKYPCLMVSNGKWNSTRGGACFILAMSCRHAIVLYDQAKAWKTGEEMTGGTIDSFQFYEGRMMLSNDGAIGLDS